MVNGEQPRPPAANGFKLKDPRDLIDPLDLKFPYGKRRGYRIGDMPVDECQFFLNDKRLGAKIRSALLLRVKAKRDDMTPAQRKAS